MKKIFIAAAHTAGEPLPELVEEIRALRKTLQPLKRRGINEVEAYQAATQDDVFDVFSEKDNDIAIFHYAGHANQQVLQLEGGGRSEGLAQLFGLTQGKALRLVFLNGCATVQHGKNLHAAGIPAVIATTRSIKDDLARKFAIRFYENWAMEGKTLEQAFKVASSLVESSSETERPTIDCRGFGRAEDDHDLPLPWNLYLNPQLDAAAQKAILDWAIHPTMPLQLLDKVAFAPSEQMRKVARRFCEIDADANREVKRGDYNEMTALIIHLPWVVGTHLRRLNALDKAKEKDTIPRLREVECAYTGLTRFICYIALSALWEGSLEHPIPTALSSPEAGPDDAPSISPDYIALLQEYHRRLLELPGDPIQIKAHLAQFLSDVNGPLQTAYHFMERLKEAIAPTANTALWEHFVTCNGPKDGIAEVCRNAEAVLAQFIEAAFFLARYKLYSVRAISVDKVRYIEAKAPFVHKTIELHAAFGKPTSNRAQRAVAGDNYSILLAPRGRDEADPLQHALSLSPFYIDKHALLSDKRDSEPAIFVLTHETVGTDPEKAYSYTYIDKDIAHDYRAVGPDHALRITAEGFQGTDSEVEADLKQEDQWRFRDIYAQLAQLQHLFNKIR